MAKFLDVVRKNMTIPNWLPKRPLVSKMLADFDVASLDALSDNRGETDFWQTMLDTICKRESRIHPSLDPSNIRSIILQLSDLSRTKMGNVGPISLTEISDTFESVVGRPPRDEASAMLQRLPVLGRIDASSSDRQFLDTYILDGLRATSVAEMPIVGTQDRVVHEKWIHHLGPFGQSVLTQHLADSGNSKAYVPFLKKLSTSSNRVLAGDLITALLGIQELTTDFGHLVLSDSHLGALNLADTNSKSFRITNSFIDELSVGGKSLSAISIEGCMIGTLRGLSVSDRVPTWMVDCTIDRFDALTNMAKIRQAHLSNEQRIFITVIHKTFFQPGSGRKEEALLRGLDAARDRKTAHRVLGMLVEDGVLREYPGKEGLVYVPDRKHTRRMARIISELKYSSDPLWMRLRA